MLEQPQFSAAASATAASQSPHVHQAAPSKPPMSRWKAASIHLGICVGFALLLAMVLFFVWYPSPLFQAEGGKQLLMLIVGVDVVIGPCITAVIFDTRKKSLKFDLAVVAVMQLIALGYGVAVAYPARPAFLVFYNDWIQVVPANALEDKVLREAKFAEFRSLSITGPKLVAAEMPANVEERNRMIFSAGFGADVTFFPKYYVPYDEAKAETLLKAKPIAELRKLNRDKLGTIDHFLAAHGRTDDTTRYLPVKTRGEFATAMIDASTGDFLGMLALIPW